MDDRAYEMSEGEADSEAEDQDVEAELGNWLGQLESLKMGLDTEDGEPPPPVCRREKTVLTPRMVMESFRMSVIGPGGGDMDLDAILGELCQLETQLNASNPDNFQSAAAEPGSLPPPPPPVSAVMSGGGQSSQSKPANLAATRGVSQDFEDMEESLKSMFSSLSEMGQKHDKSEKSSDGYDYETNTVKRRHDKNSRDSGMVDHTHSTTEPSSSRTSTSNHGNMELPVSTVTSHNQPPSLLANIDHDKSPSRLEKVENWNISNTYSGNALGVDVSETDSVHSDSVSLPSSDSGVSMATTASQLAARSASLDQDKNEGLTLSPEEQAARLKHEKIKIAMEKIKQSNINKLFVRVQTLDMCSKSIMVDERMTTAQVVAMLVAKNHCKPNLDWAVVEHMPELYMERFLEDHDSVVDAILLWTQKTKNKLLFVERPIKYDLFKRPEMYLLPESCSSSSYDDSSRKALIQEFFSDNGNRVPEMEGLLWLKMDGRKVWKKFFFVLRASGLYYNPKGKSKCSKDLVCLLQFRMAEVYTALHWKKKFKAPTEYGFALKHPQIQKKCKYIKYLCAEDQDSFYQWVMAIRIAKCGKQLLNNYEMSSYMIDTWDTNNVLTYGEQLLQIMATSEQKAAHDHAQPPPAATEAKQHRHHQRNKSDGHIKVKKRTSSQGENERPYSNTEGAVEGKTKSLENMLDCMDGNSNNNSDNVHASKVQRRMSSDSILSSSSRSTDISDSSRNNLTPTSTLQRSRRKASIPITTETTRHLTSGVPENDMPDPELTRTMSVRRSLKLRKEDVPLNLPRSLAPPGELPDLSGDLPPPPSPQTLHRLDMISQGGTPRHNGSVVTNSQHSMTRQRLGSTESSPPRDSIITNEGAPPVSHEMAPPPPMPPVPPVVQPPPPPAAHIPVPPPSVPFAVVPPQPSQNTMQSVQSPVHYNTAADSLPCAPLPGPVYGQRASRPDDVYGMSPAQMTPDHTAGQAQMTVCSPGTLKRPKPSVPKKESSLSMMSPPGTPIQQQQLGGVAMARPAGGATQQAVRASTHSCGPESPRRGSVDMLDSPTSGRQSVAQLSAQLSMEFGRKAPMVSPKPMSPTGYAHSPQHVSHPPQNRASPMSPGVSPRTSHVSPGDSPRSSQVSPRTSQISMHQHPHHQHQHQHHQHPQHHYQHSRSMSQPPMMYETLPHARQVLPNTGTLQRRMSAQGSGKKPPPPPRRAVTTRLSIHNQNSRFASLPDTAEVGPSIAFLDDLTNVIYYKEDQFYGRVQPPPYVHYNTAGEDFLPPPPPELLEGLPNHPITPVRKAPPPPPPKR